MSLINTVQVRYRGPHDPKWDNLLCALADCYDGEQGDSGYWFDDGGERDMEFEFPSRADAIKFRTMVNRLSEKRGQHRRPRKAA